MRNHPQGENIARILSASLSAVDPGNAVRRFVQVDRTNLHIADQSYDLDEIGQLAVLGFGKATQAMAKSLLEIIPPHIRTRGLLIPKGAFPSPVAGFEVIPGGHPVPNQNSLIAGDKAQELTTSLKENDLLICLISGGGSALMTSPHSGLSLEEIQSLTQSLLSCGVRIDEINTLRRHLDRVKGGRIAEAAVPARAASLILSDVVGNPLEAIASGPTAPDPSTKTDALSILQKYGLAEKFTNIVRLLEDFPETPKPQNSLFSRVQNVLIGSNRQAAQAGLEQAKILGFHTQFLGDTWQGEAREVAKELCQFLKQGLPRPFCLIAGGETTVTIRGRGRGGRNQELALAAVQELHEMNKVMLITLATDGEDGPTDAAGAVVTGETLQQAANLSLDANTFLNENDSYTFF